MKDNVRLATAADINTLTEIRFEYFKTENWVLTPEQKEIELSYLELPSDELGDLRYNKLRFLERIHGEYNVTKLSLI